MANGTAKFIPRKLCRQLFAKSKFHEIKAPYGKGTFYKDVLHRIYLSNDFSMIGDPYFRLRVLCEIRLASYGSRYSLQSLFDD